MAAHFPPYTKTSQEPTGAYRAPSEIDEVEALLKTAHAHMRHAAECTDKALAAHIHSRSKRLIARMTAEAQARGEYDDRLGHDLDASTQHGQARKLYNAQTARDVAWSAKRGDYTLPRWHPDYGKPRRDDLPPNLAAAVTAPNCDGYAYLPDIGIGDVEPRHPMQAEALRQADEFERGDRETGV